MEIKKDQKKSNKFFAISNLIVRGFVCFIIFLLILSFALFDGQSQKPAVAATGINQQLNYQARLLDQYGAVVADGLYNIEFKIYQDGNGCVSGGSSPCSGTLKWTESRIQTNRVTVKNGYFSVNLGSVTAFGTSIDWDQDTLWLSINVGGTANTPTPTWDGEMTPFRRMAAVPYAMNANQLGGLDASAFVKLAPTAVQVDSGTLSSIFINKTGASGNILQLQKNTADVLTLANSGAVSFQNATDSTTGFVINDADGGVPVFNVDTTNERVGIGTASPSNTLSVNGTADFQGHAAVGSGATVNGALTVVDTLVGISSHSTVLSVYETSTTTGSSSVGYDGLLVNNILNPSGTATYGQVNGLNGFLTIASGNAQDISTGGGVNGFNGGVIHAGSGIVSGNTTGSNGAVVNVGGGVLDIANGFSATIVQTSGTINAARGVNIATPVNFDTITDNYGLYINDQSGVGSGDSYNIYSAGASSENYFEGALIAGSGNEVLTLSTGKIDADAITLLSAVDGRTGTSSASGLAVHSDGLGMLQGCSDGQVLAWVESTDTWDCTTVSGGSGANTALSNLSAVAINTSLLPGTDDSIDLGDNTHRFRDAYLGGETLHIGTSTTDEGFISYNTSTNVFSIDTDATGAGNIALAGGSGSTGCTITSSTGALACTAGLSGTTGGFSSTISASNFSGSSSGTNTGDQTSVTGNAGTATALQNARTIGGVSFNGTANITVASATGGFTVSGGTLASANQTITSSSANALAVGLNGTSNPALRVDASTGSSATGVSIASKAAGSGASIGTISSGTDEKLSISAKNAGKITLADGSTGDIEFFSSAYKITSAGALTVSSCTGCGGGGGANVALSNLSGVAINTALLPGADNTIDLGSSSFSFRTAYADTSVLTPLVDTSGALSLGTGSSTATNIGKTGTTLTFNPTAWTATPTISGLVTATSGLTVGSGSNTATLIVNKTGTATVGSPYQDSNKLTLRASGYCCGGSYDVDFNIRNKMAAEDFIPRGYLAFNAGSGADLFTLSQTGAVVFQPTTDRTNGFQILDADGGTPIFNVDYTNERVGIGTASPSEKVQIVVGSSTTALAWGNGTVQGELYAGGTSASIGTSTNHDFQFFTNDTYRLTLEAGGDFGVGTTAPGTKLHVADVPNNTSGGIYVDDVSSRRVVISPSNGATGIPYVGTLTNNDLSLGTNNNESIRLLTNGNVGIGGTAPDGKLEVEDTAGSLMTVSQAAEDSFDRARVQIGNAGNGLDQLYVNGRFNTLYQMFFQDFLGNIATLAADGNWGDSSYDEIVGTGGTTPSGSINIQNTTGVSGAARLTFTGTLGTGPWGSNWGTAGILTTERSLNPVMEARVIASSNTDQRAVVGFTDVAANTAISADTNLSANEAFFRKTAAGTQWQAVSRAGSGTEQVTSNVGSTSSYQLLRVELDNTNTKVKFYVNNSLVATHTTAVPGSTTRLGWNVMNTPTTTTYTGRVVDIDFMRVWSDDPPRSQGSSSGLDYQIVEDSEQSSQDGESISIDGTGANTPNAEALIGELTAEDSNVESDSESPAAEEPDTQDVSSSILTDGTLNVDTANIALDMSVNGSLFANGALKVTGPAEFLNTSVFYKLATFIDKTIFRNDVNFEGDVNIGGKIVASDNSAGTVEINPGQTAVSVVFTKPYDKEPVINVTPVGIINPKYGVVDITNQGFTIQIDPAQPDRLKFNWIAVQNN